jgi:hypothetical protein
VVLAALTKIYHVKCKAQIVILDLSDASLGAEKKGPRLLAGLLFFRSESN